MIKPDLIKEVPEGAAANLTPEQQVKVEATKALRDANGGVLETRTVDQIVNDTVKAEVESAKKKADQMSPADMSAEFWMQFWPMYSTAIQTLSNKECKRVLAALVQWPLEDEKPTFTSTAGKNAFALGLRLIDSKTIMRDTVELEMLNKRMQEQEAKEGNNEQATE